MPYRRFGSPRLAVGRQPPCRSPPTAERLGHFRQRGFGSDVVLVVRGVECPSSRKRGARGWVKRGQPFEALQAMLVGVDHCLVKRPGIVLKRPEHCRGRVGGRILLGRIRALGVRRRGAENSNPFSRSEQVKRNQPVRAKRSAGFFVQGATSAPEEATKGATNPPADELAPPFPKSWMTLPMLARCSSGETVE